MTIGGHALKGWSKTHSLIVLSSGEGGLYSILKAVAETLGMFAMMGDFGLTLRGEIWGRRQRCHRDCRPKRFRQNSAYRGRIAMDSADGSTANVTIQQGIGTTHFPICIQHVWAYSPYTTISRFQVTKGLRAERWKHVSYIY